jgi:hypothetical protein
MSELKQPYEMTREEWKQAKSEVRADGMPRYNANGAGRGDTISKLSRLEFLGFGVQAWLYQKAEAGDEEALEAIEYGIYDQYSMIIKKAKEEGLLPDDHPEE